MMSNEEFDELTRHFIVKRINFKNRKNGELGMRYSDNGCSKLSDACYVDFDDVESIECALEYPYDRLYEVTNITSLWRNACKASRHLHVKMIYEIGCTVFVVDESSDIDMMDRLISNPPFFKSYWHLDWKTPSLKSITDFSCNADLITFFRFKQVGPSSMPRLTKKFYEYACLQNFTENEVKRLKNEIEEKYASLARVKFSTYLTLQKYNKSIKEEKALTGMSDKMKWWADNIWKVINRMYTNYDYHMIASSDTMYASNTYNNIMDEECFIFKYHVSSHLGRKEILSILDALIEICESHHIISDPIEDLRRFPWDDEEKMKKILKNVLNF